MLKKFIAPVAVTVFAALALTCSTTPISGKQSFNILSEAEENRQGIQAYKEVLKKEKRTEDKELASQIEKIGRQIAAVSGRPDYKWEFATIENNTPNAFCLPGGKVAVYTGILKYAKNEAGLATVLAHEVGHAIARHGGQRVSTSIGANVAMTVLGVATMSKMSNRDRRLTMAALGLGVTVGVLLPYSRSHETEADDIGLVLMARAGYDPGEAVKFWQRFGKASKGKAPPEFLSTHPKSLNRSQNLKRQLGKAMEIYNGANEKFGKGEKIKYVEPPKKEKKERKTRKEIAERLSIFFT